MPFSPLRPTSWLLRVGLMACVCGVAGAQQVADAAATIPNAPTPAAADLSANDLAQQKVTTGSVSGTVTDADHDAIPKAEVTLTSGATTLRQTTDVDGYFSFLEVPAGDWKLKVTMDGFAVVTQPVSLGAAQMLDVPDIAMAASANMEVDVSLSQHDMAEMDIHTEEKQRLIGFVPNFYVTYDWHAPPLTAKQKFGLAAHTIYDPASILINAGVAGILQATDGFAGYGQGAQGYFKRFGANTGDFTIGTMIGGAILPSLFRQDPRYFYKGTGSVRSRALYALSTAFICRGDNGKWQPNYSGILGDVASGAISNLYYPASDHNTATVTIEAGLLNALEDGVGNLVQEFRLQAIHAQRKEASRSLIPCNATAVILAQPESQ